MAGDDKSSRVQVMQLAIDEDHWCSEPDEGGRDEEVTTGHIDITSGAVLYNQGNTQVNSTGVYWAMALGLYMLQGCAQTKLCYCYHPMAKEELGQGETATNGIRCAYQGHKVEMKRREAQHSH